MSQITRLSSASRHVLGHLWSRASTSAARIGQLAQLLVVAQGAVLHERASAHLELVHLHARRYDDDSATSRAEGPREPNAVIESVALR